MSEKISRHNIAPKSEDSDIARYNQKAFYLLSGYESLVTEHTYLIDTLSNKGTDQYTQTLHHLDVIDKYKLVPDWYTDLFRQHYNLKDQSPLTKQDLAHQTGLPTSMIEDALQHVSLNLLCCKLLQDNFRQNKVNLFHLRPQAIIAQVRKNPELIETINQKLDCLYKELKVDPTILKKFIVTRGMTSFAIHIPRKPRSSKRYRPIPTREQIHANNCLNALGYESDLTLNLDRKSMFEINERSSALLYATDSKFKEKIDNELNQARILRIITNREIDAIRHFHYRVASQNQNIQFSTYDYGLKKLIITDIDDQLMLPLDSTPQTQPNKTN